MVEVDPVLDWVRFMDFEEAERYRIEVQQTWARSLGFFGRFIARHYSWFLAVFKRLGWVRISLALLIALGALLSASGLGMTLSALNVVFRDVKYVVPFMVQMGLFVTPVIYPIRYIPQKWMMLMGLNPMAGMVIGFRYALLGSPASWRVMGMSFSVSLILFVSGLYVFRRIERQFADVI